MEDDGNQHERGSSGAPFLKEQQEQWKSLMASVVSEALAIYLKEQLNQAIILSGTSK